MLLDIFSVLCPCHRRRATRLDAVHIAKRVLGETYKCSVNLGLGFPFSENLGGGLPCSILSSILDAEPKRTCLSQIFESSRTPSEHSVHETRTVRLRSRRAGRGKGWTMREWVSSAFSRSPLEDVAQPAVQPHSLWSGTEPYGTCKSTLRPYPCRVTGTGK